MASFFVLPTWFTETCGKNFLFHRIVKLPFFSTRNSKSISWSVGIGYTHTHTFSHMLSHTLFLISVSYENHFWQVPAMLFPTSFLRSVTYIIPYKLYNPYNHISPHLNLKTGCGKYIQVDLLSERISSLFLTFAWKKMSKTGYWTQDP
jgi:hypothetical protein